MAYTPSSLAEANAILNAGMFKAAPTPPVKKGRKTGHPSSLAEAMAILNAGLFKTSALPVKRGRGRPKGSKNKPKDVDEAEGSPKEGAEGGSVAKKPRKSASTPKTKGKAQSRAGLSVKDVNAIMRAHGVKKTSEVSQCLKSAILHDKVKLLKPQDDPENKYGLDQVLVDGECLECGDGLQCTIRDVLFQPDYAGLDYENGGEEATLQCPGEDCGGVYVTRICQGEPTFDSGKFHNHCTKCPDFGTCIGDYRDVHCRRCGNHYYNAGMGGKCYRCHR